MTRSSSNNNPDEFRLTLKPSEYWGEAYSALDGGHKALFAYNKTIDLMNGLNLAVNRVKVDSEFYINYIEVTVFADTKPMSV